MRIAFCFLSDVASYKQLNEVDKDAPLETTTEDTGDSAMPRMRRITMRSSMVQPEPNERFFVVGKKMSMTLAGLDILRLVSTVVKACGALKT